MVIAVWRPHLFVSWNIEALKRQRHIQDQMIYYWQMIQLDGCMNINAFSNYLDKLDANGRDHNQLSLVQLYLFHNCYNYQRDRAYNCVCLWFSL